MNMCMIFIKKCFLSFSFFFYESFIDLDDVILTLDFFLNQNTDECGGGVVVVMANVRINVFILTKNKKPNV